MKSALPAFPIRPKFPRWSKERIEENCHHRLFTYGNLIRRASASIADITHMHDTREGCDLMVLFDLVSHKVTGRDNSTHIAHNSKSVCRGGRTVCFEADLI